MRASNVCFRVHGRWRHLLFPLPLKARRYCWLKRDITERNEAALRMPYYQIKPIDAEIPEEQKAMISPNAILDPSAIDDLRRRTLVLTESPGPLPEEDLDDLNMAADNNESRKPAQPHPNEGINKRRFRYHAFSPNYKRTFECQAPYNVMN